MKRIIMALALVAGLAVPSQAAAAPYLHVAEACQQVHNNAFWDSQANANALADATHAGGFYRYTANLSWQRVDNRNVSCRIVQVFGLHPNPGIAGHKINCYTNMGVQEWAEGQYAAWPGWVERAACYRTYAP